MNFIFSKVLDNTVLLVKKVIWVIFNWFNLLVSNVSYVSLPKITGLIIIKNRGEIYLGDNVKINSYRYGNPVGNSDKTYLFCSPGGVINIGDEVSLSRALIFSQKSITIQDYVMIGGGVQIWDTNFHSISFKDRIQNNDSNIKAEIVLIKRGAFIGADSIILKGITIGENSVVAAGSVVSKSIPDNQIWGGNPARFIKKM